MNLCETFIKIVSTSHELPNELRENAQAATAVEQTTFDQTYIDFLDTQIGLNARGEEWTQRLRRRRESLRSFCNIPLITGTVRAPSAEYWVKIHPETGRIVHWENYD